MGTGQGVRWRSPPWSWWPSRCRSGSSSRRWPGTARSPTPSGRPPPSAPALSITTDRAQLERAVASPGSARRRMAVHMPGERRCGGAVDIGRRRAAGKDIATDPEARPGLHHRGPRRLRAAPARPRWAPARSPSSRCTSPRRRSPTASPPPGLVLAGVGIALIVGSVAVADRLGVRMVRPAAAAGGAPRTNWGRGSWAPGCRRRGRTNCGSRRSPSTPWPTRSSNCSPTSGSWPPTSRTGCVRR